MTVRSFDQHIRLERLSAAHWRATFQHSALSVFGPNTLPHLEKIAAAVGCDSDVKVVMVLEDADQGFFITHCDFLASMDGAMSEPMTTADARKSGSSGTSLSESASASINFGPFCLHLKSRLLEKDGVATKLGGRAMDILQLLVSRAGEVITKAELMAYAWPGLFVEETSLRVQIVALRKALGESCKGARYIANVPGRGYCFVGQVH